MIFNSRSIILHIRLSRCVPVCVCVSDYVVIFNGDWLYSAVRRRCLHVPRVSATSPLFHRLHGDFRRKYIRRAVAVHRRRAVADRRFGLLLADLHRGSRPGTTNLRHRVGGSFRRPSRDVFFVFLSSDSDFPGSSSTSFCSSNPLKFI